MNPLLFAWTGLVCGLIFSVGLAVYWRMLTTSVAAPTTGEKILTLIGSFAGLALFVVGIVLLFYSH